MFKYEMHLHTRQGSKCAASEGKEYVEFYRSLGYTGMVVTDHFFHGNTRPDRKLPWHQYMEEFLGGYSDAKEAAEGKDFDVFFGVEELFDCLDEYLIYGLEPEWFISHPEIKDMKIRIFDEGIKSIELDGKPIEFTKDGNFIEFVMPKALHEAGDVSYKIIL